MNIILGLDLSLSSPGISVIDKSTGIIHTYFYPQRKRELNFVFKSELFNIIALCPFDSNLCLYQKYHRICQDIIDVISGHQVEFVMLEGYSFGSTNSSSMSKLYELGGIVRYHISVLGIPFEDIAPTSLKKQFTGSGKAQKEDMYQTFISKNLPNLKRIFKVEQCNGVPTPVQDIVDSVALITI